MACGRTPGPPELTADDLREFREARGLTQVGLAELLRITSRAVTYWEAGARPIPGPVQAWIWHEIEDMDEPPEFARAYLIAKQNARR